METWDYVDHVLIDTYTLLLYTKVIISKPVHMLTSNYLDKERNVYVS